MDIDGDGRVEIFYAHYSGNRVIALNSDGSLRWILVTQTSTSSTGLTGAKLSASGPSSLLYGQYLITEDASRNGVIQGTLADTGANYTSLMMPLDPDHKDQVSMVTYAGIYNAAGQKVAPLPAGSIYFAAADLTPARQGLEIVGTGGGHLKIFSRTGEVLQDRDLSVYNDLVCPSGYVGGGPPTIGDFDGDPSTIEIAVATGRYLSVFDTNGTLKYKSPTHDCSSLSTGITSYDLNGDRKPEVLYADEEYFRVYEVDRATNQLNPVIKIINPSATLNEYPVVVDLFGTKTANILIASNNYANGSLYQEPDKQADGLVAANITGLRAFQSTQARSWMPTRPVWNQYSFHPDLVTSAAAFVFAPTLDPTIFRRNNQGNRTLDCL